MAQIRPFSAIRYARRADLEASKLIAPPYDVLSEADKAALEAKHPNNIVAIDLPHLPPKTVGPDAAYRKAAETLRSWIEAKALVRERRPALYPYSQKFEYRGRQFDRRGFFALVKLSPFGAGDVVPHEKTHREAIEDRLKLMRATNVQLSPIFGLYDDPRNAVASLLFGKLGRPEMSATLGDVRNDLWSLPDAEVENQVIDMIRHKSIYIADGHHRYTTALEFQAEKQRQHGGALPESHPANWCMFVLVGMQDRGLQIWPTHRLVRGIAPFDYGVFKAAISEHFEMEETRYSGENVAKYAGEVLGSRPAHTFGLFDGRARKVYELRLRNADVLKKVEPKHSEAWRRLDVAILQRYLIEEVIRPVFGGGSEPVLGYTADPDEIAAQTDGQRFRIALLVQPTPLGALAELGKHGEVMPQKSTYFYPKLATGMVINPLQ